MPHFLTFHVCNAKIHAACHFMPLFFFFMRTHVVPFHATFSHVMPFYFMRHHVMPFYFMRNSCEVIIFMPFPASFRKLCGFMSCQFVSCQIHASCRIMSCQIYASCFFMPQAIFSCGFMPFWEENYVFMPIFF